MPGRCPMAADPDLGCGNAADLTLVGGVGTASPRQKPRSHDQRQPFTYWHVWRKVRALSLTPEQRATPLMKRPYDLGHSGVT